MNWQGRSDGLESSGERLVWHTDWLKPQTRVPGLSLTGQHTSAPGFEGARALYRVITGDLLFMLLGLDGASTSPQG